MRIVQWEDERGYIRRSMVRDEDPDTFAQAGIPLDPPDLDMIDWDWIKRELHNTLVEYELYNWDDVVKNQNGANIQSALLRVLKRPMINLYRNGG